MKRQKKFAALRVQMAAAGVTQQEICDAWNLAHPDTYKYPNWVSGMMCGKIEWKLEVMYFVADLVGIPYDQLHVYFPRHGGAA